MRSTLFIVVLAAAAMAVAPMQANAGPSFGGEVFGAFNTYAMGDVNDAIDALNGGGAEYDEIGNGMTGGLGLRVWATENWMFSGVWEPLFATTEDASGGPELTADASSFQFTGSYYFPSATNARYGIGAGLGYYSLSEDTGEGSAVGFHFLGMGEWTVSRGFSVTGGAGYRVADVEVDNAGGASVDYTGFMARLGLAFYMPTNN
jgi:hypothetical protein